jgi:surface antigen
MKLRAFPLVALATLSLSGCGAGMAVEAAKYALSEKEKEPAERIAVEQEKSLTEAHGGTLDVPIAWADEKSGVKGSLVLDGPGVDAKGCRKYRQNVILAGQTLLGTVSACPQKDESWVLVDRPKPPKDRKDAKESKD